jgi:hypothetical protein
MSVSGLSLRCRRRICAALLPSRGGVGIVGDGPVPGVGISGKGGLSGIGSLGLGVSIGIGAEPGIACKITPLKAPVLQFKARFKFTAIMAPALMRGGENAPGRWPCA